MDLGRVKDFAKDHIILVGAAVGVAAITVAYYLFFRQKKYCPGCNAWISQMDPSCPYCNKNVQLFFKCD